MRREFCARKLFPPKGVAEIGNGQGMHGRFVGPREPEIGNWTIQFAPIMRGALLDDLGNDVEAVPYQRSIGLVLVTTVRFGNEVGAKRLGHVQRVSHWTDSVCVDGIHLFDEFQNGRQLVNVPPNLVMRDVQAREMRDVQYGFGFEWHLLVKSQEHHLTA